jgi:hypothetical protein
MKLILEPTNRIQSNGVPHRVWKGETDLGVTVEAYRAVSAQTHDPIPALRRELVSFYLRLIL